MPEYNKPLIDEPTFNSKEWWAATKEHRLLFQRCRLCQTPVFFPRYVCPGADCLGVGTLEWEESSGRGRIFSFTVVRQPMDRRFNDDVPYVFALIQLDEHWRMWSNVIGIDPGEVRVGQRVEVEWDDVTGEVALPKFRVVA
ncbi:MAG: Zn-ribbon domain-containing OB-fold protein [Dehalococcoidia bacterium]